MNEWMNEWMNIYIGLYYLIYSSTDEWKEGRMNAWMNERMNIYIGLYYLIYKCMKGWMNEWMNEWMYIYIYRFVLSDLQQYEFERLVNWCSKQYTGQIKYKIIFFFIIFHSFFWKIKLYFIRLCLTHYRRNQS